MPALVPMEDRVILQIILPVVQAAMAAPEPLVVKPAIFL
jgi:hypothetical protein